MEEFGFTKGRNERLGSSLVSLGPHGGIYYKRFGWKDTFGIHKKRHSVESRRRDEMAWGRYLAEHPHDHLTKTNFLKKRYEILYKKQHLIQQAEPFKHFSSDEEFEEWKRHEALAESQTYAQRQAAEFMLQQKAENARKKRLAEKKEAAVKKEPVRCEKEATSAPKKQAERLREKTTSHSWDDVTICEYYYHQKNLILQSDSVMPQQAHPCGTKTALITSTKDGHVTIQCDQCKAQKKIPYNQFLMLYYNARKLPNALQDRP